jgi:hypothetical protein
MTDTGGFEAYSLYHSLRLHFTSPTYDFVKYNGKTNVSKDNFLTRKDKFSFYKLSRQYYIEDLKNFLVANFVAGRTAYVQELLTQEATDTYTLSQKRLQALSYNFKQDLEVLFNHSPAELLKVKDGQVPLIVTLTMRDDINLETFIIINDLIKLTEAWDGKIEDDIIWPSFRMRCIKYSPFISYDKQKFKKMFMEVFN